MHLKINAQDGKARAAEISLKHGSLKTPIFMPVGTYGAVKSISPNILKEINFEIILGNTYHLQGNERRPFEYLSHTLTPSLLSPS